jgi:hypothetical protein
MMTSKKFFIMHSLILLTICVSDLSKVITIGKRSIVSVVIILFR